MYKNMIQIKRKSLKSMKIIKIQQKSKTIIKINGNVLKYNGNQRKS